MTHTREHETGSTGNEIIIDQYNANRSSEAVTALEDINDLKKYTSQNPAAANKLIVKFSGSRMFPMRLIPNRDNAEIDPAEPALSTILADQTLDKDNLHTIIAKVRIQHPQCFEINPAYTTTNTALQVLEVLSNTDDGDTDHEPIE